MSETMAHDSTPGAVEELVRDDVARKRFLKTAGKRMGAGAAATSFAAFIAACGGSSSSSSTAASTSTATSSAAAGTSRASASGSGDLAIVNYALTLEYLESQFYAKVIKSGLFHGTSLSVIKTFGAEETEHVAALKKVAMSLGKPAPEPKGKFPIKSAGQVTKLARAVENLGAAAYLGQAGNIKSKEILAAALAIITNQSPTPEGAFAKPMTMAQVLAVVKPFIA
jgi:hypothetical protein